MAELCMEMAMAGQVRCVAGQKDGKSAALRNAPRAIGVFSLPDKSCKGTTCRLQRKVVAAFVKSAYRGSELTILGTCTMENPHSAESVPATGHKSLKNQARLGPTPRMGVIK